MGSPTDPDSPSLAGIAEALLPAVSGADCVAWIGSGLSRPAYPDWIEAVSKLCQACAVDNPDGHPGTLTADQLIDKAEACKVKNVGAYEATLAGLYGGEFAESRMAYNYLIKAPFRAYVTTNFDPLLSETAATFNCRNLAHYPNLEYRDLLGKPKALFYIHGHARPIGVPSGKNLVLARSEFNEAYKDVGIVDQFVRNVLLSHPIVFFGCTLREPEIKDAISRVHAMHLRMRKTAGDAGTKPRIALLPAVLIGTDRDVDAEHNEAKRFSELNTTVFRYVPSNQTRHWEVEQILRRLCELTSTVGESGPGEAGPS